MSDKLLRRCDIAAMLGTTPGVAASILSERGCNPIDFGYGRGRGPRWLESAVIATIRAMHMEAQPQATPSKNVSKKSKFPKVELANMSASKLYELLTPEQPLQ